MGGRMHRAVVLLIGLLLALAAAVVVALPLARPAGTRMQGPATAVASPAPWPAKLLAEAERSADAALNPRRPLAQVADTAFQARWWAQQGPLVAGMVGAGGAAVLVVLAMARWRALPGAARSRAWSRPIKHGTSPQAAMPRGARAHIAAAQQSMRPSSASCSPAVNDPATERTSPATDAGCPSLGWVRSEAGDGRATAALSTVDEALAAGGRRSRAVMAATPPDRDRPEVWVVLALHPAERNAGHEVSDRMRAVHPAWPATANGAEISVEVGGDHHGAGQQLVLPALQTGEHGPWTYYLYASATHGLAIMGAGAVDVLHGVLADMVCMYPPAQLGLTLLGEHEAELYRAAPQWVEPPTMAPTAIERLEQVVAAGVASAAFRPLLLAVVEPDDELVRALSALEHRLAALRTPPVVLLVAAERPSTQLRAFASALPLLALRARSGRSADELRVADHCISGEAPRGTAGDVRELLRWLPRFGAAPSTTIWDTISAAYE